MHHDTLLSFPFPVLHAGERWKPGDEKFVAALCEVGAIVGGTALGASGRSNNGLKLDVKTGKLSLWRLFPTFTFKAAAKKGLL